MARYSGWLSNIGEDVPTPVPHIWPVASDRVWVGHMEDVTEPTTQRTWFVHGPYQ